MNTVTVLRNGYAIKSSSGEYRANCTITLIRGKNKNILVDTGLPLDKDFIIDALDKQGLKTEDIHVVIGTHGHSDHVGNLNLFPHSLIIVGCDICQGDVYLDNDLTKDVSYVLDEGIEVMYTPDHTGRDVSVIVRNTLLGTVAVVGDLFEREEDIEDGSLWRDNSEQVDVQDKYRRITAARSDFIIPGHGPMFKLLDNYLGRLVLNNNL